MISRKQEVCLILDNIRSVHNVGSIFRTAEALGISKLYCIGTTPLPVDRFGKKRKDFAKVSLGTEEMIAWEHVDDSVGLVKAMKKSGFNIVAIEQATDSVDCREVRQNKKMAIILGNEVNGVDRRLLNLSDCIVEIPLRGRKESLNVSVAAGIALFCMFG